MNHFTNAARSLGYSQTAVSVQMRNLEKELGVKLFDRIGRGIQLTEAGRRFYPQALEVISAMESAAGSVRDSDMPSGELRIGTTSSLAEEVLTYKATEYVRKYPEVRFSVSVINDTEPLFDSLRTGAVDIVYYMDERTEQENCEKIYEEEKKVIFVTHRDNRLTSRGPVTMSDISTEPVVISDRETNYFAGIERELYLQDTYIRPSIMIGSVSGVIRIIEGGYGVAYVPEFMVERQLQEGSIVRLNVYDARRFSVYGQLFIRKNKWISPAIRAFIDLIENEHTDR